MSLKLKVTTIRENYEGNRWVLDGEPEVDEYGPQQWPIVLDRIVALETLRFFRGLGGRETVKKGSTAAGYDMPIESVSVSPGRTMRTTRRFEYLPI